MRKEQSTITATIVKLVNNTIETNKLLINEGNKLLNQLTSHNNFNNLNWFQNTKLNNAFSEYVDLNVKHFRSLVDLSVNFINILTNDNHDASPRDPIIEEPSFILTKSTAAGTEISFEFLLENIKPHLVLCELVNSSYILQSNECSYDFITHFNPQSFELEKEKAKPVSIHVSVNEHIPAGLYIANVQVKGFEPSYFSIHITVSEKQKEPNYDAVKKTSRKKSK